MFTGIVETMGTITGISPNGSNISFTVQSPISHELKIDQSVAHNGVCLTVVSLSNDEHTVTAIAETIHKTNTGDWKVGNKVNLERCLQFNGRIDGHIVQGHVDATGTCIGKEEQDGSWLYTFSFDEQFAGLLIEKGSICLNGISLTIFNVSNDSFSVAIIPYTYEHTNIGEIVIGNKINLEFDVLGKYMQRHLQLAKPNA